MSATEVRSLINQAQLDDTRGELLLAVEIEGIQLEADIELDAPEERALLGTTQKLRGYELRDESGAVIASGAYWVELDLPE